MERNFHCQHSSYFHWLVLLHEIMWSILDYQNVHASFLFCFRLNIRLGFEFRTFYLGHMMSHLDVYNFPTIMLNCCQLYSVAEGWACIGASFQYCKMNTDILNNSGFTNPIINNIDMARYSKFSEQQFMLEIAVSGVPLWKCRWHKIFYIQAYAFYGPTYEVRSLSECSGNEINLTSLDVHILLIHYLMVYCCSR